LPPTAIFPLSLCNWSVFLLFDIVCILNGYEMIMIEFSVVIDVNIRLSCLGSDPILKSAFAVSEKCNSFNSLKPWDLLPLKVSR